MKICLCIVDGGQYLNSYDSWINIFANRNFTFDVFVITTDFQRFMKSPLNKVLRFAEHFNKASIIISCVPDDSKTQNADLQLFIASAIIENIRECHQFDFDKTYDWYIQSSEKTGLTLNQVDTITEHVTRAHTVEHCAILQQGLLETHEFHFILTNDRFLFSFLQNIKFFIRTLRARPLDDNFTSAFITSAFINQVNLNNVGLVKL